MSSPTHVSDGDYGIAQQDGQWSYERPFAGSGDFDTYIASRTMKVDANSLLMPIAMTQLQFPRERNSTAYLVGLEGPQEIGGGLLAYREIYAPVPRTRTEYGPVVFTQGNVLTGNVIQSTDKVQGEYVYEYSLGTPLPTLLHTIFTQTTGGIFVISNGVVIDTSNPTRILVEDAISQVWMCRIYERVSIYTVTKRLRNYTAP